MADDSPDTTIFNYPRDLHLRKYGPRGYTDYQSYKPWLRDEFQFRCVYCLCRESWLPTGDAAFSVDHLRSASVFPELICEYPNLVYACCYCNSAKSDINDVLDICIEGLGNHVEIAQDGTIHEFSSTGSDLIKICQLDRPRLTEFRNRMITLYRKLDKRTDAESAKLFRAYFGYPRNLPNLSTLRPPDGNTQRASIRECYFEKWQRGVLPDVY